MTSVLIVHSWVWRAKGEHRVWGRREKQSVDVQQVCLLFLFLSRLFVFVISFLSSFIPISCLCLNFSVQNLDWDCLEVSTLGCLLSLCFLVPCREELCASAWVHLHTGMGWSSFTQQESKFLAEKPVSMWRADKRLSKSLKKSAWFSWEAVLGNWGRMRKVCGNRAPVQYKGQWCCRSVCCSKSCRFSFTIIINLSIECFLIHTKIMKIQLWSSHVVSGIWHTCITKHHCLSRLL